MQKDDFNLAILKALRQEINIRIIINYILTGVKYIVGLGLLIYLLYGNHLNEIVSPFLFTATFAFLLDIAILENLGWIRNAGSFIRRNLENTDLTIVRWESEGAQTGGVWSCFTVQGYLLGTWSIGLLLFVGSFIDHTGTVTRLEVFATVVSAYFLVYSFYLVFAHLGASSRRIRQEQHSSKPSPIIE